MEAVEFDRCFAAEHVDEHFELALLGVDFADAAVEALERTVDDANDFSDGVVNLVLRLVETHALLNLFDFFSVNWVGSASGIGMCDSIR